MANYTKKMITKAVNMIARQLPKPDRYHVWLLFLLWFSVLMAIANGKL